MKLSAVVITLNEEKDLQRCLKSLKSLVNEIVIVDSGSTDKTIRIAEDFGAKIYFRKFDNFANQKNYASSKTEGDWLLFVDADEEITSELANEILKVLNEDSYIAYSIPRKNIILGKYIKYSRWQPELDRHVWLSKRGRAIWVGDVHEELKVDGDVGKLKYPKLHYSYATVTDFLKMIDKYSGLEKRVKFSYFRLFWDPIYNFLVRYFYRLGFLDGVRGFILSYLMAIYHLEVWVKVWEKEKAGINK